MGLYIVYALEGGWVLNILQGVHGTYHLRR